MNERQDRGVQRPLSVGYFFSLGHSTIVVAIGAGLVIAEKAVYGAVSHNGSGLEQFGGVFGTIVSASFLYLIALLNIVILAGILKVFRAMRNGTYDEAELERQLNNRGLMFRFFGRWMRAITKEWQMYPVGVVFGMGFDTATEVALLATTALLAVAGAALVLDHVPADPLHGRHGADGHDRRLLHERRLRLGLLQPGAQDLLQPRHHRALGRDLLLHRHDRGARPAARWSCTAAGRSGSFMANFNINAAGFIIVGMFVVTWARRSLIWRFGHIEARWDAKLRGGGAAAEVEPESA